VNTEQMAASIIATVRASAGDHEVVALSCDCHNETWRVDDVQWPGLEDAVGQVQRLVEHALHDHVVRHGIQIHRTTDLLIGFQLGQLAGLPATSEYEERWRIENPLTTG
jgi:hypothetical protein